MVYTISDGLRDREYAKFTSEQIGSQAGVNVSNILKSYDFGILTASTGAGSGLFTAYTTRELNGILKAIVVKGCNFEDTGSIYLFDSGTGIDIWNMQSGTTTSSIVEGGAYIPKGIMRTTTNLTLSGTNIVGMLGDIPLYGTVGLIGSGMGASKSGLGVTLVYQ